MWCHHSQLKTKLLNSFCVLCLGYDLHPCHPRWSFIHHVDIPPRGKLWQGVAMKGVGHTYLLPVKDILEVAHQKLVMWSDPITKEAGKCHFYSYQLKIEGCVN